MPGTLPRPPYMRGGRPGFNEAEQPPPIAFSGSSPLGLQPSVRQTESTCAPIGHMPKYFPTSAISRARHHCPTRSGLTRRSVRISCLPAKPFPHCSSPSHLASLIGYIEYVFTGAEPENYYTAGIFRDENVGSEIMIPYRKWRNDCREIL